MPANLLPQQHRIIRVTTPLVPASSGLRPRTLQVTGCKKCRSSILSSRTSKGTKLQCSKKENHVREGKPENKVEDWGVAIALMMLRFYKSEISPFLPSSCRYVPSCSEYAMIAYKRYGVVKGTILTAWRLCRCNPFGGSGFDPPRWFGENTPPQ